MGKESKEEQIIMEQLKTLEQDVHKLRESAREILHISDNVNARLRAKIVHEFTDYIEAIFDVLTLADVLSQQGFEILDIENMDDIVNLENSKIREAIKYDEQHENNKEENSD